MDTKNYLGQIKRYDRMIANKIEEIKNVSVSDININGSDVTMTIESSEGNYNGKGTFKLSRI